MLSETLNTKPAARSPDAAKSQATCLERGGGGEGQNKRESPKTLNP